jgi:hypothetical protein
MKPEDVTQDMLEAGKKAFNSSRSGVMTGLLREVYVAMYNVGSAAISNARPATIDWWASNQQSADKSGAENAQPSIDAILKSPEAVYVNMLRGEIAKPSFGSIKNLYPEEFAKRESDPAVEELKAGFRVMWSAVKQTRDKAALAASAVERLGSIDDLTQDDIAWVDDLRRRVG